MQKLLLYLFLSVLPCKAADLLKEFGTMYVNINESVTLDFYDYFQGSFLNYSIKSSEGETLYLSNNYSLSSLNTFIYSQATKIDGKVIHSYIQRESCQFLIAKGLEYFIYLFDLVEVNPYHIGDNITTSLIDAKIIGGGVNLPDFFLIINGIENVNGKNISVNEMLCLYLPLRRFYHRVKIWDLRYVENLKVVVQDLTFPYFWGTLYGKSMIFVGHYNYNSVYITQQICSFFRDNSTDIVPLEIVDMMIVYDHIYLIDQTKNLIIFKMNSGLYIQNTKISMELIGTPLKFQIPNPKKFYTLTNFGIITTEGIATFNYEPTEISIFFPLEIPEEASISILNPHLFLYSNIWKELRIYTFSINSIRAVSSIPFDSNNNTINIISGIDEYYVIISNSTQLELLNLLFEEPIFLISTSHADTFEITAEDKSSKVCSTLILEIIDDNNQVNLVNYYRKTSKNNTFINYLDSLQQPIYFDLFKIVAGWNLSVEIVKPDENIIDFDIVPQYAYLSDLISMNLSRNYSYGLYEKGLYLLDSQGVYKNEEIVINQTDPINITGGSTLQILYENNIIFYDFVDNSIIINQTILYNCSDLFKSLFDYTFCANDTMLQVYKNAERPTNYTLKDITNGEKIIDITMALSVLNDVEILYILTTKTLYKFIYNGDFIEKISIPANSQFILSCDNLIYAISDSILVYDDSLMLINTILLPGKASAASNIFQTLYLKIDDFLYVFVLINPIVQSFIGKVHIGSCNLLTSTDSVLILCENKADVYFYECQFECRNSYQLNIKSLNYEKEENGVVNLQLKAKVNGSDSFEEIYSNIELIIYSFEIFFEDDELENKEIVNEYNFAYYYSLEKKFRGFDISSVLYVNDSLVQDPDFPIIINNGISNITYNEPENEFIDHDIIRDKNIFLVLLPDSINIYLLSVETVSNSFTFHSKIPSSNYFNSSGYCSTINYISTKSSESLFVLDCTETKTYFTYSKESIFSYEALANYFIFIIFDFNSFTIINSFKFGVDHKISWINVIPSSSSCFIILFIDIPYDPYYPINNNLVVYSGKWQETVTFEPLTIINFSSMNLKAMLISSADGTFKSSQNCKGPVYLFVSDIFYGIWNVLIEDGKISLMKGVEFTSETIFSVGVCGSMLYSLSNLTYIHSYYIHFHNSLSYQFSYKPFYQENFNLPGSLITCSNYYQPRYLSVYYKSMNNSIYQLRIVDLLSSMYSSYLKFIDFYYNEDYISAKTRFLNENTFTSIGATNASMYIFNISKPSLVIQALSLSQYEKMVKKYGTSHFRMKIGYSNSRTSKNSSEFLVIITQTKYSESSTNFSHNVIVIAVVAVLVVFVIVLIVVFLVYKRFIRRKKKDENIQLINIIDTAAAGRMRFNINYESCISETM